MKKKIILLCLLVVAVLVVAVGCGDADPYKDNDGDRYNVSVRFDANGGSFTTTDTPVIVDSYNITEMGRNAEGMVEIPLLAPDAEGRKDACNASKDGCFLVGWYAKCTDNGDGTFTYAEPWDFAADRVKVDPNGSYSSKEPVLTLYAAWAPEYTVEYYDLESGEMLGVQKLSPAGGTNIQLPVWNEETGALDMFKVPAREGYTFMGASYDDKGVQAVEGNVIAHPAVLNMENATVENGNLKLYTTWRTGQWYRISTAKQFTKNFSLTGCYELQADLDFTDEIWPTAMMHGSFAGIIEGNGHKISNVTLTQTDNSKLYTGLFGNLTEKALLSNVSFENVNLTVKKGARVPGAAFGVLAGNISAEAKIISVSIANSQLLIDSGCYFATDDYVMGLVSGTGTADVDPSGITCTAVGDNPEKVNITVNEGALEVTFVTE